MDRTCEEACAAVNEKAAAGSKATVHKVNGNRFLNAGGCDSRNLQGAVKVEGNAGCQRQQIRISTL